MDSIERLLEEMGEESRERFARENAILSFRQFLELLVEDPYRHTRSAAQYAADMMDHFGVREIDGIGGKTRRFRIFDDPISDGQYAAVGQEEAQNEIYRTLREFEQRRHSDKLILLHGPNGSSKTTLVTALVRGLEAYSRIDEGMLLRVNWIFSEGSDRGESLGFNPVRADEDLETFAFLPPERVSAKIPCELSDHPMFLIPRERRRKILEEALEARGDEAQGDFVWTRLVAEGQLSPKSKRIYDALLRSYHGDLRKVLRHVQVERFYVSKRFRNSAVTIEPQGNIDAQSRQLGHSTMTGLPPVLQNETLFEAHGDLIDGNRGVVEYSDFFKRPIEANKYLLTTAENGVANLPSYTAFLDVILIGTSNENYLMAFRRDPLFSSFKARLELIRVPYLLEYPKEREIYERHLSTIADDIHVAPHTATVLALWATMTRLMQPTGRVEHDGLRRVVERMTPLEKAKLYGDGTMPPGLNDDEKALLAAHVPEMCGEYDQAEGEFEGQWDAAYEGRRGASPREVLTLLSDISLDPVGRSLTPLLVLRSLPQLTKDKSLYQFLRIKPTKHGYHDCDGFVDDVRREYLELLRDDVNVAAELVDEEEYGRLLERYFLHVRAHATNERVEDEATGRFDEPDPRLMERVEGLLDVTEDLSGFRSSLMTKAAAFRLAHPDVPLVYDVVFGELYERLRRNVHAEKHERLLGVVEAVLVEKGALPGSLDEERAGEVGPFVARMEGLGYNEHSLLEALEFFYRQSR